MGGIGLTPLTYLPNYLTYATYPSYSYRSATIGSMRVARSAGT